MAPDRAVRLDAARRIIVALDRPGIAPALQLVETLRDRIRMFKVGLELFCASGPTAVREITAAGADVFLDLKFYDIPETVARAVAAVAKLGVSMLNVHAEGGREMMAAAARAARQAAETVPPDAAGAKVARVIAVTILTSRGPVESGRDVTPAVVRLALAAKEAGLAGVVASPREARAIKRACGSDFLVVTPGVRPAWASLDDQKRVATPAEALVEGADFLVIGRPITAAPNPRDALERILDEIEGLSLNGLV